MNNDRDEKSDEIRRLRRMLKELGELAEHASMTGSLEQGAPAAVRRYNAILQRLQELGAMPGSFSPLGEAASFAEIRVESTMLASYLHDEEQEGWVGPKIGAAAKAGRGRKTSLAVVAGLAPFVDKRELVELLHTHEQAGERVNPELLLALAPFLPREEITRLVHEHLRQWDRPPDVTASELPRAEQVSQTPESPPPTVPAGSFRPASSSSEIDEIDERQRRVAELDARIDELSTQLREGDLTAEDRTRIIDEVARVAAERAALRRETT